MHSHTLLWFTQMTLWEDKVVNTIVTQQQGYLTQEDAVKVGAKLNGAETRAKSTNPRSGERAKNQTRKEGHDTVRV